MDDARPTSSIRSVTFGIAAALPAIALLLPHLSYVPMWDGGDYLARLRMAALSDFSARNYFLSSHPTFLYALVMSAPVRLFPESIEAVSLVSIFFFALSVAAVRSIALGIRPGFEATLLAACYALCPALLANVLHFSADLGVAIFFPIYLALLLRRPGPMSAAAGSILANTKELGLVLYAASVPIYLFTSGARRVDSKCLAYLLIPAALTAAFYLLLDAPPHRSDFSETVELSPFNVFSGDRTWRFLADALVLSFSWIPSAVLVFAGYRAVSESKRPIGRFLTIMLAACSYAITRVPTWNNTRYMLPAYALLFLLSYLCLPVLVRRAVTRCAALSVFGILLAVSNLYSFDPVSSRIFWPLELGERKIWGLQRREARDQLVYNLQYINLHYLFGHLLAHVRPTTETVFAGPPGSGFYDLTYADPDTLERSFGKPGDIRLRMLESHRTEHFTGPDAPRIVHFVEFPTLNSRGGLRDLEHLGYTRRERRTFTRNGYSLGYLRLEKDAP